MTGTSTTESAALFPSGGDNDELASAIDACASAGTVDRNFASVEWQMVDHWLAGVRNFKIIARSEGMIRPKWVETDVELNLPGLEYIYRIELGRLLNMDTSPFVERIGFGLESVRKASTGMAALRYMCSQGGMADGRRLHREVCTTVIKYGMCGIYHSRLRGDDIGGRTSVTTVPPWELLPIPANVDNDTDCRGIIRRCWLPLRYVRGLAGIDVRPSNERLDLMDLPYGVVPGEAQDTSASGEAAAIERTFAGAGTPGTLTQPDSSKEKQPWVRVDLVWLYRPGGFVSRFIVKLGRVIAIDQHDDDPDFRRVVPPIAITYWNPTGLFYSRGFLGSQLALLRNIEAMLDNQFRVVREWDEFKLLVIPQNSGISMSQLKKSERRKITPAISDPTMKNEKPYAIPPETGGDLMRMTAKMGIELLNLWSGQSELYSGGAPGRAEAAAALGFLHETGSVNIAGCANSIGDAYAVVYRSMLQAARREVDRERAEGDSVSSFVLPAMTDQLIGLVVDPLTGAISLDRNPLPHPWEVRVDVRQRTVSSRETRRQDLGLMHQSGLVNDDDFVIINEREGLGWDIRDKTAWETYRSTMLGIMLLYGDGETPGDWIGSPGYERDDLVLRLLHEFMASPEFRVASSMVKNAVIAVRDEYAKKLGMYPDQMPGVEEMAAIGSIRTVGAA
jgi:hypothetical protein